MTCGLDAGVHCRRDQTEGGSPGSGSSGSGSGCEPRVWRVAFDSDVPAWGSDLASTRGIVATLDSWAASGAAVTDSHLHHGRYGVRWKSSHALIARNRISARYIEISPLEYYMEGPLQLTNITVADNIFGDCAAPVVSSVPAACDPNTHLPLGYWRRWTSYGGGTGGVCKAAAVGASQLDPAACSRISITNNKAAT
jgi:hypothetical protein